MFRRNKKHSLFISVDNGTGQSAYSSLYSLRIPTTIRFEEFKSGNMIYSEELPAVNSIQMQKQLVRQLEMTRQSISNAYAEWERFRKKEDGRSVKLLRSDNARPRVAFDAKDIATSLGWWVTQHSAYLPGIASLVYRLFRSMRHSLSNMHFRSDEIQKWLDDLIASKDTEFLQSGIYRLPERWLKLIENDDDYLE